LGRGLFLFELSFEYSGFVSVFAFASSSWRIGVGMGIIIEHRSFHDLPVVVIRGIKGEVAG
jgi:hypothetical protein